jgi:lipocalin
MVLAFISLLSLASAWVWSEGQPGPCPHIPKIDNFDINHWSGRFYMIARTPVGPETVGQCVYVDYTVLSPDTIGGRMSFKINGIYVGYNYTLVFNIVPGQQGKYKTVFQGSSFNVNVLEVVPNNYISVYMCDNLQSRRQDAIHIIARDRHFALTNDLLNRATELGFDGLELINQDENFCSTGPI